MSSKESILKKLRGNVRETYDMPDLSFEKLTFQDPVAQFIETAKTTAGANVIVMENAYPTDSPTSEEAQKWAAEVNEKIREAYPEAKVISSNIVGVKADRNPDLVADAQELDGTDVGIIEGTIACAENACVWVPMNMKEKAICFISEYLVLIVPKQCIVSNMHDAYAKLKSMGEASSRYGFGTFISGPSKTADIEQALVYGAQAARGMTILVC